MRRSESDLIQCAEGLTIGSCIREIVFDLGGVFFMWPDMGFFDEWAQRLGFTPKDFHSLLWYGPDIEEANIGLITCEEYCRRCAKRLRISESVVHEIIYDAFYCDNIDHSLIEYVAQLRKRFCVSALTNTWSFGRMLIEQRGLTNLFDLIITSAEEGYSKPDTRIFEITLQRLGANPTEVIFIDDTEKNLHAAQAVGMHGIFFSNTNQLISDMEVFSRSPKDIVL